MRLRTGETIQTYARKSAPQKWKTPSCVNDGEVADKASGRSPALIHHTTHSETLQGSVPNSEGGEATMCAAGWELRGHAEDGVDELALRYSIALSDPADLTFADCVHRLVTLDRSAGTLHRSEPEARRNPLLDEPMVLLDDVVQKGRCSATTAPAEFAGLLEFGDRAGVGQTPIYVDHAWRGTASGQCEAQEQLRRDQVPFG